jgi:hypothetical protein
MRTTVTTSTIKVILFSALSGFLFTVLIYAIDFETRILRYVAISFFYFVLYLWLYTKYKKNNFFLFITTVATPILIDSSVLITYPEIIPLRFPFASIFPLLGALMAVALIARLKLLVIWLAVFCLGFFAISHTFIIPSISYNILNRNPRKISDSIFNEKFYTVKGQPVELKDTCSSTCNLLEFYFVGCAPCEQKLKVLKEINDAYENKSFSVFLICDGRYTTFEKFMMHQQKVEDPRFTFLFDRDSVLFKKYELKAYPFEILANKNRTISTQLGFEQSAAKIYYRKKLELINKIFAMNE